MPETAAALVFAHMVADFMLQTEAMVARKKELRMLLLHIAIVAITAWAALGFAGLLPVALIAASHLAIDAYKAHRLPATLESFLADQGAHVVIIAAVAAAFPATYAEGFWATRGGVAGPALDGLPEGMVFLAGLVAATQAGSFAVGLLMAGLPPLDDDQSLPSGGRMIGLLERALVFLLVLNDQTAVIGFLIAAKSVLRFGEVQKDRRAAEYVIIGTLASFAWGLAMAAATQAALDRLGAP